MVKGTGAGLASSGYRLLGIEKNPYGTVPFVIFSDRIVFTDPWCGGGLGPCLTDLHKEADRAWSDIADLHRKNVPMLIGLNLGPGFRPVWRPGTVIPLTTSLTTSDLSSGVDPRVESVSAVADLDSLAATVERHLSARMREMGFPPASLRLDDTASQAPSGIAIRIAEAPLRSRAKKRTKIQRYNESRLWRKTLIVAGAWTGNAMLKTAAKQTRLSLWWDPSVFEIPSPEADVKVKDQLDTGRLSLVQLVMREKECTRQEAMEHLKQVKADQDELKVMFPPDDPLAFMKGGDGGGVKGGDETTDEPTDEGGE
jgi:hypothetical protein